MQPRTLTPPMPAVVLLLFDFTCPAHVHTTGLGKNDMDWYAQYCCPPKNPSPLWGQSPIPRGVVYGLPSSFSGRKSAGLTCRAARFWNASAATDTMPLPPSVSVSNLAACD